MLTISEQELEKMTPAILERKFALDSINWLITSFSDICWIFLLNALNSLYSNLLFLDTTHHTLKKRTPVGQYPSGSGKVGGTLRRGWTIGEVKHEGNDCIIEVINPLEYASYVEYGHRQEPGRYVPAIGKRLKRAWVTLFPYLQFPQRQLEVSVHFLHILLLFYQFLH